MNHKNFAQSTLAAAITDTTGTAVTVVSGATFPAAPFIASIDTEAFLVGTVAGTTWTVTRGYEGSTAATHSNGSIIYHDISAAEADAIAAKVTGVTATAPVTSSGGAAPVIALPAATASVDGYETKEQVTKLDGIAAGATANAGTVTGVTGTAPVASSGGAAPAISMAAATASVDGYATKEQITKLDGIEAGANNYVLPDEAVTYAKMQHVSATDKLLGRATAGAGDVEEIACTAAGRALIDDANAAAQLATLGAAAASAITNVDNTSDATKNAAAVTVTNHRFTRRVDTQTTTDTITPEISTYDIFVRTAQAHALVINNHSSSTPVDGDMMLFEILSDATIRAITYGNMYVAKAGVALPAATVASKNLTMLFIWRNDLSQWVLLSAGQEA